jgi:hypothetical protein
MHGFMKSKGAVESSAFPGTMNFVVPSSRVASKFVHWHDVTNIQNDAMCIDDRKSVRISPNRLSLRKALRSSRPVDAAGKLPPRPPSRSTDDKCLTFIPKRIRFVDDDDSDEGCSPRKVDTEHARSARKTSLLREMKDLEGKIQEAVGNELKYLQSLCETLQTRMRCEEKLQKAVLRRPRAVDKDASATLESYISHATDKVTKATQVELGYKRKIKRLHDKRYRWSMMHEHAGRELRELDPTFVTPSLPPLFALSFF